MGDKYIRWVRLRGTDVECAGTAGNRDRTGVAVGPGGSAERRRACGLVHTQGGGAEAFVETVGRTVTIRSGDGVVAFRQRTGRHAGDAIADRYRIGWRLAYHGRAVFCKGHRSCASNAAGDSSCKGDRLAQ